MIVHFTTDRLIPALAWALRQDKTILLGAMPHGPEYCAFLGDRVDAKPQPTIELGLQQAFTDLIAQYDHAHAKPRSIAAPGRSFE